jgi:hypothetical protein
MQMRARACFLGSAQSPVDAEWPWAPRHGLALRDASTPRGLSKQITAVSDLNCIACFRNTHVAAVQT